MRESKGREREIKRREEEEEEEEEEAKKRVEREEGLGETASDPVSTRPAL